jgi:hypothetical protein
MLPVFWGSPRPGLSPALHQTYNRIYPTNSPEVSVEVGAYPGNATELPFRMINGTADTLVFGYAVEYTKIDGSRGLWRYGTCRLGPHAKGCGYQLTTSAHPDPKFTVETN